MQREEAIAQLRADGYRWTAQRQALLDTIWALDGHFTVETLRAQPLPMDPSTIYRTLERLVALGVLHVLVGSSPTEYERAREPHHHLLCEVCGRVVALADYHLAELAAHLLDEHDFVADLTHLAIPGRCRPCAPQGDPE